MLNRARRVLWVVTGADKAGVLAGLRAGDPSMPAARISRAHAVALADRGAAAQLGPP